MIGYTPERIPHLYSTKKKTYNKLKDMTIVADTFYSTLFKNQGEKDDKFHTLFVPKSQRPKISDSHKEHLDFLLLDKV